MKYDKKLRSVFFSSAACLTLGMLSGIFSKREDFFWYSTLIKPSFNPPNWVFAPIWTFLYISMGIVWVSVWDDRKKHPELVSLFVLQLVLNLVWSPLFFGAHRIDLALYDIAALWLVIVIAIVRSRTVNNTMYLLFIPYLFWVSFAALLNYSLYMMNP